MNSATRSRFSSAPCKYVARACSISGVMPSCSAASARSATLSSIWNSVSPPATSFAVGLSAIAAEVLPLLLSIHRLHHEIVDTDRLLRAQFRFRAESKLAQNLHVLGFAQCNPRLSVSRPKDLNQSPVDVSRFFKTRDIRHVRVSIGCENRFVILRSDNRSHGCKAFHHVLCRQTSWFGSGVPGLALAVGRLICSSGLLVPQSVGVLGALQPFVTKPFVYVHSHAKITGALR